MNRRTIALAIVTALAFLLAMRLRVSGDLTALFPSEGEAAALSRYTRAFGGGDVALVLIRSPSAETTRDTAAALEKELRQEPHVADVITSVPLPPRDPTHAWVFASKTARDRLAHALTEEGMRERLAGTKEMLLAPSTPPEVRDWLAEDPLRLSLIPWEGRMELAAGLTIDETGTFVADEGRARLIAVLAKGAAFDPDAAKAFVKGFESARARVIENLGTKWRDSSLSGGVGGRSPLTGTVSIELTGGHAMSAAMRTMLQRDLEVTGVLSLALASLAFLLIFRRPRALLAVMPPVALGTVWTAAVGTLLPGDLSAISVAFAAVVVGVGVDTGVHVYSALLDARRRGLTASDAANDARAHTWRPTLVAAIAAGLTFMALGLSSLRAVRELGLLCGVGEILTAVSVLAMTPEIGAWLERNAVTKAASPRWPSILVWATRTRPRAAAVLVSACVPIAILIVLGMPQRGPALVALRPSALAPIKTQTAIFETFGGKSGQWIVLTADPDPNIARARADSVSETLDALHDRNELAGYDALSTLAPGKTLLQMRLAARDALALPTLIPRLENALVAAGFDKEACAPALQKLAKPTTEIPKNETAWLLARYIAHDEKGTLVASYVRPTNDPAVDARVVSAIHAADPYAVVTGYPFLEAGLKDVVKRDMPRVATVAFAFVVIALSVALRRGRKILFSLLTLGAAIAFVLAAMRVFHIEWHAYDALVVPVLLGITMDEAMFLLFAVKDPGRATEDEVRAVLDKQGPLVLCTATTTAAGFGALLACQFEGLRDVGAVGAIGSSAGVLASLVIIPACLRLSRRTPRLAMKKE